MDKTPFHQLMEWGLIHLYIVCFYCPANLIIDNRAFVIEELACRPYDWKIIASAIEAIKEGRGD